MKRSRKKNRRGLISGKHSLQRRGDCSSAEFPGLGPDHLAVVVADRQVLVEHVDDRRVRQRVPRDAQEVVAEQVVVLEVDDVGPVREQKVAVVLGRSPPCPSRAVKEVVEPRDVGPHEVLVGVLVDGAHRRVRVQGGTSFVRAGSTRPSQEHRLDVAGVPQCLVEAQGVSLCATRPKMRVVVTDDQNLRLVLHGGARHSRSPSGCGRRPGPARLAPAGRGTRRSCWQRACPLGAPRGFLPRAPPTDRALSPLAR